MKQRIRLMVAPTGHQPGNYVPETGPVKQGAATRHLDLEVLPHGNGWRIGLRWPAPEPVRDMEGDPGRFVDAAALMVPLDNQADWLTMGSEKHPVEGLLWRANAQGVQRFSARGLGTTERGGACSDTVVEVSRGGGQWQVLLMLERWSRLTEQRKLGIAIWQGHLGERAGLKSVSPGWVEVGRG